MPVWTPNGPKPLDPRQARQLPAIPSKLPLKNPIYTQQSPASPVHLSGSLVLTSGSSGTVPVEALKNPMGQDMELLEVKFELSGALLGDVAAFGATIQCELSMGAYKLTNGAIPVWGFGRAENLDGELKVDSTDTKAFLSYSWRLPRPLFIPAGAVVTPSFSHAGLISSSINVRIGYSARTVFTKPKKIYMPWVAKYNTKTFNPISAAGVDSSSELDLVNPNAEALNLQRFTGRALYLNSDGGSETAPQSFGTQYLMMRMVDSYGRPIVPNFTPFRSVFHALTRSWDMDNGAQLDPGAFYKVTIRKDATSYESATGVGSGQAFITMVGWRELGAL